MFLNRNDAAAQPTLVSRRTGRPVRHLQKLRLSHWPEDGEAAEIDTVALVLGPGIASAELWERLGSILACRRQDGPDIVAVLPPISLNEADAVIAGLRRLEPHLPDALMFSAHAPRQTAQMLDTALAVAEIEAGIATGTTALVAAFGAADPGDMPGASSRLVALAFDGDGLATALGIAPHSLNLHDPGSIANHQRARVRLAAAGAGIAAIDGLLNDSNGENTVEACRRALHDGFTAVVTEGSIQRMLTDRFLREKF